MILLEQGTHRCRGSGRRSAGGGTTPCVTTLFVGRAGRLRSQVLGLTPGNDSS